MESKDRPLTSELNEFFTGILDILPSSIQADNAIISLRTRQINSLDDLRNLPPLEPYISLLEERLNTYIAKINEFNNQVAYWRYYLRQDDGDETIDFLREYGNVYRGGDMLVAGIPQNKRHLVGKCVRAEFMDVHEGSTTIIFQLKPGGAAWLVQVW